MIDFINFAKPNTGNFLVDIIAWLVQISTSITVGVILFTVLLKLITLPFDFFSRASMRKNSLLMEEMRPELEKLQKQYADNKQLYNQKMMALYKKHGYSMFGACLPTILTLVIFIVAINAFTNYSKFQNQEYFYNMGLSYDNVIYTGMETDDTYITRDENGTLIIDAKALKDQLGGDTSKTIATNGHDIKVSIEPRTIGETTSNWLVVSTTNAYVRYENLIEKDAETGEEKLGKSTNYYLVEENIIKGTLANEKNNFLKILRDKDGDGELEGYSYLDAYAKEVLYKEQAMSKYYAYLVENEDADEETLKTFEVFFAEYKTTNPEADFIANDYLTVFMRDIREQKAAETFRSENEKFLWVKNIWVADNATKHPVESEWESFKASHGYSGENESEIAKNYSNLIAKLSEEQSAPNGYFILVVITAGISFLMQIVMTKAQKAQMELQTVNGQGMQTQKVMKWLMPILMAVFSFMYTAAFSIYIIISNLLSIGTTYGINFIVDRKFKKKKGATGEGKKVIRGRVYVPKEEEKEEPKKAKKEKKNKKDEEPKGDFLSGTADKKHIRGRLK